MKQLLLITSIFILIVSCQKDDITDNNNNTNTSENFIGRWNRDTVIETLNNNTELIKEVNYGIYRFNADETGLLTIGNNEFAVTWFYMKDQQKINISEKDWVNQTYDIVKISSVKYLLTGRKYSGNNTIERKIFLRKIN